MSVYFPAQTAIPFAFKLSTTSATVIAGSADHGELVDWFQCTEIAGGTPNLTIELYDGTTSYYLQNAVAMTAKQSILKTHGIALHKGWYLRVTASVANQVDVVGAKVLSRS